MIKCTAGQKCRKCFERLNDDHRIFLCSRLRAVSAVPLPARRSIPSEGSRRASQHGHHDRGLSLVDVARAVLPSTLPLHRLLLPAVQRLRARQSDKSFRGDVARAGSQHYVPRALSR